ncbi:hypothetical protein [Phytohabitans kaempferiae]|uniref:Uncharacterized protein n=1 Tax=Phytohabitans kaempferiae TaxID=1620943 RepID=A0ABV6M435_9ACTN
MSFLTRWWARTAALLVGTVAAVLVPAAAWAADNEIVLEAAQRRPRLGGFGLFAGLCCLIVVALVVIGLLALTRSRRGGPRDGPR